MNHIMFQARRSASEIFLPTLIAIEQKNFVVIQSHSYEKYYEKY